MKKTNKKGFTLAELLVVVAIIAVLVAILIPIFTSQLEKSRDAVSVANLRAAYAEAQTALLAGEDGMTGVKVDPKANTVTVTGVEIKSQKADSWSGVGDELPFTAPTDEGKPDTYKVTWSTTDGAITDASTCTLAK